MRLSMLAFALVLAVACGDDAEESGGGDSATNDSGAEDSSATELSACATFCQDNLATCSGDNAVFTDAATCETACAAWPAGTAGDTSGNSLACRSYHLGAAASDAATHCPHAADDGGGVCVDAS